jgi:hypothetical protein
MSALVDLVVIDEVVICTLCPAPRRLVGLTGKDARGSRDGHVGGVVKAELIFLVEAGRRNRRAGQPVERDVVEDIVSGEVARGMPLVAGCR